MRISIFIFSLFLGSCAWVADQKHRPCAEDAERLGARARELQEIVAADQKDRSDFFTQTQEELMGLQARDALRRQRVAEIHQEGCMTRAPDFAAGALVFQHGDKPEHYLRAHQWAKQAVELGDPSQRKLAALAVDRYLIARGQRQLFASQAQKTDFSQTGCWCLRQVEPSYPDVLRKKEAGRTLAEARAWVQKLNEGRNCPAKDCEENLAPSPEGTVPGYW